MYRTIGLIQLLAVLVANPDADARTAGVPKGPGLAPPPAARREQPAAPAPLAAESRYYADSFSPLREDVRAFERDPGNRYTYCIRNVATYECLSYASDGGVRRRQHRTTAHGTGFAYKLDGEDTRLLTNEHVVSWPFVTDAEHAVEDVPLGCKLVGQKLSIVDNDDDEYEPDDVPLTRVIDDRALDVAVVRAKGKLPLLPYRIGRSSELSAGDVVIVRGPARGLPGLQHRQDHQHHRRGSVQALGSHRLHRRCAALQRQLREPGPGAQPQDRRVRAGRRLPRELHARSLAQRGHRDRSGPRSDAPAQAGDRTQGPPPGRASLGAGAARAAAEALAGKDFTPFIGLGPLLVRVHAIGSTLLFEVYTKGFPLEDQRIALLVDAPAPQGFGRLEKVWFGNGRGYKPYGLAELGAEESGLLKRLMQRMYALASSTLSFRQILRGAPDSRQAVEQRTALRKALSRAAGQDTELAQLLLDLAQEKSPDTAEGALPLRGGPDAAAEAGRSGSRAGIGGELPGQERARRRGRARKVDRLWRSLARRSLCTMRGKNSYASARTPGYRAGGGPEASRSMLAAIAAHGN